MVMDGPVELLLQFPCRLKLVGSAGLGFYELIQYGFRLDTGGMHVACALWVHTDAILSSPGRVIWFVSSLPSH